MIIVVPDMWFRNSVLCELLASESTLTVSILLLKGEFDYVNLYA